MTPRAASHAGASAPSTSAAVDAVFAARHVSPTAVTVRNASGDRQAGARVEQVVPSPPARPSRQRRASVVAVVEVARPPRDAGRRQPSASSGCSVTRTGQDASSGPATRTSPPRLSTSRAAERQPTSVCRDQVGGPGLRGRAEVERHPVGTRTASSRNRDLAPRAGRRSGSNGRTARRRRLHAARRGPRRSPSDDQRPAQAGVDQPVGHLGRPTATRGRAATSSGSDLDPLAGATVRPG